MSQKHKLIDVFTPTSPAKVTFVERAKQDVNNRLVRGLELPGNQVVIYGHSGSGKSTLLENVLYRTYEKQINTNCMQGMTFEEVILDAFDQLEEFYVNEVTNSKKNVVDAKAKAVYLGIQAELKKGRETRVDEVNHRLLPPQLTPQSIGRLLGKSGYCWVLEDFHKIEGQDKKKLAQMMKVFVNLSSTYPDLKIVALGAVNTARQVVQYDKEMRKRVSEIHVKLMDFDEIKEIIDKGCKALNIIISNEIKNDIAKHSNGLASICHKICYLMCSSALVKETLEVPIEFSPEDLRTALSEYVKDEEDTLKDALDSALKIEKVEATLRVLIAQDQDGAHVEDLFSWAKEMKVRVTKKKIQEDLDKLTLEDFGELVKLEDSSKKYSFLDPFYCSFIMAYFDKQDKQIGNRRPNSKDLLELIDDAFRSVVANYSSQNNGEIGHDKL